MWIFLICSRCFTFFLALWNLHFLFLRVLVVFDVRVFFSLFILGFDAFVSTYNLFLFSFFSVKRFIQNRSEVFTNDFVYFFLSQPKEVNVTKKNVTKWFSIGWKKANSSQYPWLVSNDIFDEMKCNSSYWVRFHHSNTARSCRFSAIAWKEHGLNLRFFPLEFLTNKWQF